MTAVSTTAPGSATEIAKRCIDRGADLILTAGGDGTINEVINGMVYSDVPMGVLPGGTANVLAMEIGIGGSLVAAARQVADWTPARISVGLHHDGFERPPRYFLLMCGAGLDAKIVYGINASLKAVFGKLSYWIGGFAQLGRRFPEFKIEVDGQHYNTSFALITRVRNYGGDLEIARSVTLLDEDFEMVLFSGESSFHYLRYMLGIVTGRLNQVPGVAIVRAKHARLHAPDDIRMYTQVDGEYAGPLPAEIDIVPRAITLLLPPAYRKRQIVQSATQEWTTSHTR